MELVEEITLHFARKASPISKKSISFFVVLMIQDLKPASETQVAVH
jgi:hypothetical protein